MSLGGRVQRSVGLVPPGTPVPAPGEYGGPYRELSADEQALFLAGRTTFDREFGISEGLGAPRMNGDSCRACHFDPVIGGSGPRGVNVMRQGIRTQGGQFAPPAVGTILHKVTALRDNDNRPQPEAEIFEHRQTPALFGMGLIELISDDTIIAGADPDDLDGDGISGRVSRVDGGALGRFGWKAQVPSLAEFVRDAVSAELGMTLPLQPGLTFGSILDNDDVPDPEMDLEQAELLLAFMSLLGEPPRQPGSDQPVVAEGELLFDAIGCAACHTPSMPSAEGPVALYSDLLLHEILPDGALGIEDASANMWEFRTAPHWGLSQTAPYMHSGEADTIDQAIRLHDGEAGLTREAYLSLTAEQQAALLAFLDSL